MISWTLLWPDRETISFPSNVYTAFCCLQTLVYSRMFDLLFVCWLAAFVHTHTHRRDYNYRVEMHPENPQRRCPKSALVTSTLYRTNIYILSCMWNTGECWVICWLWGIPIDLDNVCQFAEGKDTSLWPALPRKTIPEFLSDWCWIQLWYNRGFWP